MFSPIIRSYHQTRDKAMKKDFVPALTTAIDFLRRDPGPRPLSADDLKHIRYDQHIGQAISPGLTFHDDRRKRYVGDCLDQANHARSGLLPLPDALHVDQ